MGISKYIKALLSIQNKKQLDLMPILNMSSTQSLSNKFSNERWSADDIVKVAQFCGCKLAFIFPDGQQIVIENEKSPDE